MIALICHGPRMRATQVGVGLSARADARLMGGPDKPGHDNFFKVIRNA
jgi:hypothetical protein